MSDFFDKDFISIWHEKYRV